MYQIVNGIPQPQPKPLEKVDWRKYSESRMSDPFWKLQAQGMTQKEALIACLNMA